METVVTSSSREVKIGGGRPTVIIGERINPTGKKKLTEALTNGNLDLVRSEALAQVQAGADILDVNVGAPGVDEVELLPRAVQAVMDTVDVPLCIDSANPAALEAALKVYRGKPLVNSVTCEKDSLDRVLPLVKEYGAAVIGLVLDDEGIPKDSARRISIAHRIVEHAGRAGIDRENIVIDCLTFSVGTDTSSGMAVLDAIRNVKTGLGVNLTLGASNFSFGLPDRDLLNNAFVAMAIDAGLTCIIADTARVRTSILAADLVLGRDKYAKRYIAAFRQRQKQQ